MSTEKAINCGVRPEKSWGQTHKDNCGVRPHGETEISEGPDPSKQWV